MRGAQRDRMYAERPAGIIPADAGSTPVAVPLCCCFQDHPRGCGEHLSMSTSCMTPSGSSSPRMRGAPPGHPHQAGNQGIIPADAGSTEWLCGQHLEWQDHPRGCGEHSEGFRHLISHTGSSPRMRGAPPVRQHRGHERGIISADAGSTHELRGS